MSAVENFGTKELSAFVSLMLCRTNLLNFAPTKAQKDNIIGHLTVGRFHGAFFILKVLPDLDFCKTKAKSEETLSDLVEITVLFAVNY